MTKDGMIAGALYRSTMMHMTGLLDALKVEGEDRVAIVVSALATISYSIEKSPGMKGLVSQAIERMHDNRNRDSLRAEPAGTTVPGFSDSDGRIHDPAKSQSSPDSGRPVEYHRGHRAGEPPSFDGYSGSDDKESS